MISRKQLFLILIISLILCLILVSAQSGCCSGHDGVCGCKCCDGTSLSSTCQKYYPQCSGTSSSQAVIPSTPPKNCIPKAETLCFGKELREYRILEDCSLSINYTLKETCNDGCNVTSNICIIKSRENSFFNWIRQIFNSLFGRSSEDLKELNYDNNITQQDDRRDYSTSQQINSTIKLANWNLQIFGDTKASKPELMRFYANTIDDYDITFIQEIRDADGSSFVSLCSMLSDYNCKVSSRAGRSTSKEQYGVIYKKGILIKEFKDYNPDSQDRWERPPVEVLFDINGYEFRAYNIHAKPDDVKQELVYLEQIASNQGNSIVLGDLNADCDYYNSANNPEFDSWRWAISDNEDTTSSSTNCAYDRIILNNDAYEEYSSSGIFSTGINKDISDHYLVWVELNTK